MDYDLTKVMLKIKQIGRYYFMRLNVHQHKIEMKNMYKTILDFIHNGNKTIKFIRVRFNIEQYGEENRK